MATAMTLAQFYNYVRTSRQRMADVYREVEEIQFQFNDLHTRQLNERNKVLTSPRSSSRLWRLVFSWSGSCCWTESLH